MFWKIMLEINPGWRNVSTLVVVKKEWDAMFASINGFPYSRTIPSKVDGDVEVEIRVRALQYKPCKDRLWNPLEFFVYPFATPLWDGRYKAPNKTYNSNKKVIRRYLVYLNEVRDIVNHSAFDGQEDDVFWITCFNHTEPKYHDISKLVREAKQSLKKLQVLERRSWLRKK
jgi:hypothetical protein